MPKISTQSVLHVDDGPAIRTILSMQWEEAGIEARQAEEGIDGLASANGSITLEQESWKYFTAASVLLPL